MVRRRQVGRVACVALAALAAALGGPGAAGAQSGGVGAPVVSAAVQVTNNPDPARAHSSPQIAVNPKTGELVILENEMRTKKTCDIHLSSDRGVSWHDGGDVMIKPYTDCAGDPISSVNFTVAFTPQGVLYAAFTARDPQAPFAARADRASHVFLARSTDSGRSFHTTFVYKAPEGVSGDPHTQNRRPMVAVDPNEPNWVYVSWMQPGGSGKKDLALIAVSEDSGRTFSPPVDLGPDQGAYQVRPTVDGQGVVHVVSHGRGFASPAPADPLIRPLFYRRSSDHGKTWSPIKDIDPGNAGFSFGRKALIKSDPSSSMLYVSWYGNPNPRAKRPAAGAPVTPEFDDRDIYVRTSSDSGATWSDAKVVNDDSALPMVQHYDPGLSIAPNGRVDIAWLDFRNSPVPEAEASGGNDGGFNDVYLSWSNDKGKTFAKNVRVTDRSIDRRIGIWSNNQHSHAYVGVASTDDMVYLTWQDTRNGSSQFQAEDVYFASVRMNGAGGVGSGGETGGDDGVPSWLLVGAGLAIGMGVAVLGSLAIFRRRSA